MDCLGTILLLEPDHILRDSIALALKRNGYLVFIAEDWIDALALCLEHKPQLILMEILLPQMNGLDFLKELKRHEKFKETKTIIITALAYRDILKKAIELGADDFLVKPIDIQMLLTRVCKALPPSCLSNAS